MGKNHASKAKLRKARTRAHYHNTIGEKYEEDINHSLKYTWHPISNLMMSVGRVEARSIFTVSPTLVFGSGYRMVLPSCVTMNGTPPGPTRLCTTLPSLYYAKTFKFIPRKSIFKLTLASSAEIGRGTYRPFVSYKRRKFSPVFGMLTTSKEDIKWGQIQATIQLYP